MSGIFLKEPARRARHVRNVVYDSVYSMYVPGPIRTGTYLLCSARYIVKNTGKNFKNYNKNYLNFNSFHYHRACNTSRYLETLLPLVFPLF